MSVVRADLGHVEEVWNKCATAKSPPSAHLLGELLNTRPATHHIPKETKIQAWQCFGEGTSADLTECFPFGCSELQPGPNNRNGKAMRENVTPPPLYAPNNTYIIIWNIQREHTLRTPETGAEQMLP